MFVNMTYLIVSKAWTHKMGETKIQMILYSFQWLNINSSITSIRQIMVIRQISQPHHKTIQNI